MLMFFDFWRRNTHNPAARSTGLPLASRLPIPYPKTRPDRRVWPRPATAWPAAAPWTCGFPHMPIEAKPLFRPDVLRKQLAYFNLPAAAKALRPELSKWAELIESKQIDDFTEKEILPDFLTLFFAKLLGYAGPADQAARSTMPRQTPV